MLSIPIGDLDDAMADGPKEVESNQQLISDTVYRHMKGAKTMTEERTTEDMLRDQIEFATMLMGWCDKAMAFALGALTVVVLQNAGWV